MAALLWKTIQQRALRLLGACALLIGAGTVSAQSYTLALPPAQTCAAGAASAPGNYPFNVGRWFSPQRLGPSWDFFFNNYGQLTAMWYGFDSAGRPVWYISETQYLETLANGDQIWRAKVRRTNQADGAPIVVSTVGEIALSIIAGQPDQMALRWAIDGTGALPDDDRVDCVVRRGSAAAGPTTRVTSSSYSGYWYAPSNSGWGINVLMLPPGTDNPTQWVEENAVAIYDIDTNPSWFLAERLSVGAPSALLQTLPLSYVRWNAAAGAPNGRCTQACSSALSTSGSFSRRYDAADIGAVAVSMVGAVNGQNFSFIRGQTSVPLPTLKLTDAHGISATPSPCQASVGSVSCVVNVEWDGAPNIFGVSSRPFYREIGATTRTALSSAIEGALPVTLETGKRYVFELLSTNNVVQAASSEVRALPAPGSDELPDAAIPGGYSPALDYQSPQANANTLAGATVMEASTSGGAASVRIPIQVPPGRAGMQPSVSLSYSSRAGNGVAGMGMSVSAAMAISRCPQTLAVDGQVSGVRFDASDRLCLDGQRLLSTQGGYGLLNTQYRTEIDRFSRVTQLGGGLNSDAGVYFLVEAKSGERMYFGAAQSGVSTRGARVKPAGAPGGATLSWMIDTRLDRSDNNVQYSYTTAYGSGENLLVSIVYTGAAAAPGDRTVDFLYEARPDRSSSYLFGALSEQTVRLQSISTRVAGALVRRVRLGYEVSAQSGRSALSSLQECFAGGSCLPSQSFAFSASTLDSRFDRMPLPTIPAATPVPSRANVLSRLNQALTGVGEAAAATQEQAERAFLHYLAKNGIRSPAQAYALSLGTTNALRAVFDPEVIVPAADFDGDGSIEALYSKDFNYYIVSYDAERQIHSTVSLADVIPGQSLIPRIESLSAAWPDFDGDGRAELPICSTFVVNGCDLSVGYSAVTWSGLAGNTRAIKQLALPNYTSLFNTPSFHGVASVKYADLNLDGRQDLLAYFGAGGVNFTASYVRNIYVYYGKASSDVNRFEFELPVALGIDFAGVKMQDFDGDGIADFEFLPQQRQDGSFTPWVVKFGKLTLQNNRLVWSARQDKQCQELLPAGDGSIALECSADRRYLWAARFRMDINSDGLQDVFIGNNAIRLNEGGRLGFPKPVTGEVLAFGAGNCPDLPEFPVVCRPNTQPVVSDIDADGHAELLRPYDFALRRCKLATAQDIIGAVMQQPFTAYFCPPPVSLDRPHPSQINGFEVELFRNVGITANSFWYDNDTSLYKWEVIQFLETATGFETATDRSRTLIAAIAPFSGEEQPVDLFGDGLLDWASFSVCDWPRGCAVLSGDNYGPTTLPNGELTSSLANTRALFINEHRGADQTAGLTGAPKLPEMLISVSNGNGQSYRWNYATLSSKAGRTGSQVPLYTVPARSSGQGYIDENHFYFASSMPVVAAMFHSNGIGGENETRYGYEEAMYNNKGRGFSGFRKIYTEDVANSLRSATVFHQKFPRISEVECSATQKLSDVFANLDCASVQAISLTKNTFTCDGGTACTYATAPITAPIKVFTTTSVSVVRDLNDRARIVTTTDATMGYDSYGNVTSQTATTKDFGELSTKPPFDPLEVRSATLQSSHSFAPPDLASWWLDKLNYSTSTVSQSYGTGHAGGLLSAPARTTTTLMGYAPNRQVDCEALTEGSATKTCAPATAFERKTTRAFDSFGNVVLETTNARDMPIARSAARNFTSSDGYFPNVISDANGRSVTTSFDARFGVPISVIDANNLQSTTTLDVMGRPVRVVSPEAGGVRSALPTVMAYEICGLSGVSCIGNAKTRVVSSQYGGAQSAVYLDSLGRTLRSAAQIKGANYSSNTFIDATASVTETAFNARGLVRWQYEPARGGPNSAASTEFAYDELGRLVSKLQRFNRVDQDNLAANSATNYRRTQYQHTGLTTKIGVCQAGSAGTTCAVSGSNADGSLILNMARSFDSAGKLLSTADALGAVTHYWFDAAGNPLQIKDVLGLLITATYNNFGHRLSVSDPDRGSWQFAYNGLGELRKQCDARVASCSAASGNFITRLEYDNLGRVLARSWSEPGRDSAAAVNYVETNVFENSSASQYGTLKETRREGTRGSNSPIERWKQSYVYDALNRATQTSTSMQLGGAQPTLFRTQSYFDRGYGRVKQMVYPNSVIDGQPVSLYAAYDGIGELTREGFAQDFNAKDTQKSAAIRTLETVDGRGLAISQFLGASVDNKSGALIADWKERNVYDSSGWLLARCVSQSNLCSSSMVPASASADPLNEAFRYDVYGNLKKHVHGGVWLGAGAASGNAGTQAFTYDALHRLTQSVRTGASGNPSANQSVDYGYDAIGGLLKKTDFSANSASAYSYVANTHRVNSVALMNGSTASYGYDPNGNVTQRNDGNGGTTLQYDVSNLPRRISRSGIISDFYDGPGGRYWQRLTSGGVTRDTIQLPGTFEREVVNGAAKIERYYVAGQLLTIDASGRKLSYLHQDRLGSNVAISQKPMTLTGQLGSSVPVIVEHRGFDAFGKALDGGWGTSNLGMLNLSGGALFNQGKRNQRGFTGHEHLDEFALIHMNGRAYDFNLGRFLGVDPFVQFPSNSQSLNPYGYLMNNPLSGTDPTGYLGCEAPTGSNIKICDSKTTPSQDMGGRPRNENGVVTTESGKFQRVTNASGHTEFKPYKQPNNGAGQADVTRRNAPAEPSKIGERRLDPNNAPWSTKFANSGAEAILSAFGLAGSLITGTVDDVVTTANSAVDTGGALIEGDGQKALESSGSLLKAVASLIVLKKVDTVLGVKGATKAVDSQKTSQAARRESMRRQGIPTSQQPTAQSKNASGREYQYETPSSGGATQVKSVQQQTMDRSHPGQGHWEAGAVKTDDAGNTRLNNYGRPKLTNDKSKVDYDD